MTKKLLSKKSDAKMLLKTGNSAMHSFAGSAQKTVVLTGETLTLEEVYAVATDPKVRVRVSGDVVERIQKAHQFIKDEMKTKIVYGVNTGFGPMASHIIGRDDLVALQENLIRSHAAGIGNPIDREYVVAAMVVRLNTMLKGYSGVSMDLVNRLESFINHRMIPVIPEHGAVGTSGDLVQLAHIALALIGEGEVWFKGKVMPVKDALKAVHMPVHYTLKPKEGLALINGTSVMAGIASVVCMRASSLVHIAHRSGALALELVHGFSDCISEVLHGVRPHAGQVSVAARLRELLASSKLLRNRAQFQQRFHVQKALYKVPEGVQEFYSFRCIPQILGPLVDTLANVRAQIVTEINSVTDNPIIDSANSAFLHGGNFHGDYVAVAMDQLKIPLAKLSLLSERRVNFFLSSHVNQFFPPFLNLKKPGLTLALQGLQFVATSTAAQNQTFATPHTVHSIPTNADNQDVVSMGTDGALIAAKVVDNLAVLLAIELITLSQAVDYSDAETKLCESSKDLFKSVRRVFAAVKDDRVLIHDLPAVVALVKNGLPYMA